MRSFPSVQPGALETTVDTRRMRRRGRFDVGSLRLWVPDHFGFWAVHVATLPAVTVVVHPAAVDTPLQVGGSDSPWLGSLHADPRHRRDDGELVGLRPYVPGDRLHLVHWPTLRRGDGPYVKEFASEPHGGVRIVVDDRAGSHRRQPFEVMLGLTVSLLSQASARGLDVELTTLSGEVRVIPPDAAGTALAMSMLATLRPRAPVMRRMEPASCTVVTTAEAASTLPRSVLAVANVLAAPG
jgi:uncharacterized protein (DUF58 family)